MNSLPNSIEPCAIRFSVLNLLTAADVPLQHELLSTLELSFLNYKEVCQTLTKILVADGKVGFFAKFNRHSGEMLAESMEHTPYVSSEEIGIEFSVTPRGVDIVKSTPSFDKLPGNIRKLIFAMQIIYSDTIELDLWGKEEAPALGYVCPLGEEEFEKLKNGIQLKHQKRINHKDDLVIILRSNGTYTIGQVFEIGEKTNKNGDPFVAIKVSENEKKDVSPRRILSHTIRWLDLSKEQRLRLYWSGFTLRIIEDHFEHWTKERSCQLLYTLDEKL